MKPTPSDFAGWTFPATNPGELTVQVTLTLTLDTPATGLTEQDLANAVAEAVAGFRKLPLAVVDVDNTAHEVFVSQATGHGGSVYEVGTEYVEALIAYNATCSKAPKSSETSEAYSKLVFLQNLLNAHAYACAEEATK